MTFYPKTLVMNALVALGAALLSVGLLQQSVDRELALSLAPVLLIGVTVFGLTAYALTYSAPPALRTAMIWSNGAVASLLAAGAVAGALFFGASIAVVLAGALFYSVPLVLNIQTLRELARNLTSLPKSDPLKSTQTSPRMKIRIIEQATSKQVYMTEVHVQGANYEPNAQEYFNLAWKAAIEDGVVVDAERGRYVFMVSPQ